MKVKIGNTIYDAEKEPIMIICTYKERQQIAQMSKENTKYCQYPGTEEWTKDNYKKINEWMNKT